jgi:hypothetical protein
MTAAMTVRHSLVRRSRSGPRRGRTPFGWQQAGFRTPVALAVVAEVGR